MEGGGGENVLEAECHQVLLENLTPNPVSLLKYWKDTVVTLFLLLVET